MKDIKKLKKEIMRWTQGLVTEDTNIKELVQIMIFRASYTRDGDVYVVYVEIPGSCSKSGRPIPGSFRA